MYVIYWLWGKEINKLSSPMFDLVYLETSFRFINPSECCWMIPTGRYDMSV